MGITKLRWRIERDYLDLKQEIGIGHYEGRGWRGFHHHATLCIAAYAFLILERETIPPSGPRRARQLEKAEVPEGYKPRGHAPQAGEAYAELYRDTQTQDRRGPGESPPTMSLLRRRQTKSNLSVKLNDEYRVIDKCDLGAPKSEAPRIGHLLLSLGSVVMING